MSSYRPARFTKSPLRLAGAAIAWVCLKSGRLAARIAQRLLLTTPSGDESRVLVFRLGSIGDHLAAMPVLAAIKRRHPSAQIRLVTNAGPQTPWPVQLELMEDVVCYASVTELRRFVGDFSPDAIYYLSPYPLSLMRSLRDCAFFRSCGVRRGIGFAIPDATGWRARALRPWYQAPPEWLRLASACGLKAEAEVLVPQPAGPAIQAGAVALAPTGKSETQYWPMDRYGEVVRHLRSLGVPVVWLGAKDDLARIETSGLAAEDMVMAGSLSLPETLAVISRCRAVVGNDSGLAHAAAALGVPVVVVSSARAAKGAWIPAGDPAKVRVLRADVGCEACERRECPSMICLKLIEPGHVIAALRELGVA